ncbi:MAG TPA: hypothetical protein VK034_05190 [Enhygromyxa sp.]|nr:hypothetical protein [Enhygromyxa sp.]
MHRRSLASLVASFFVLTLGACAGKPMSVQDPLSAAQPIPITRDGKLASFGSWTNERTKGGAIRKVSVGAGPWGAEAVQQDFEYSSSGGASNFAGSCSFDASGQNVAFAEFGQSSAFACTITPAGGEAWKLHLARVGDGRSAQLNGSFAGGGQTIEVVMTRNYADGSTPMWPVGYHFLVAGSPVAAIQLTNPAQVWIAGDLDPALQDAVAAASGALIYSYPAVQQTYSSL